MLAAQTMKDGLHDDHRPIDHQAKIYGPQTHQIRRDPKELHHAQGKHHRQGNDRSHDEPAPPVAQEKDQNKDDDQAALQKIGAHGAYGVSDQPGTVDEGLQDHAFRKRGPDLLHPLFHRLYRLVGVGSFEHEHLTADHLALSIVGDRTEARCVPIAQLSDIADQKRNTRSVPDHDLTDLLQRAHKARSPNEIGLMVFFDVAAPSVLVVLCQRVKDFMQGHLVALQSVGIHSHLVLPQLSAPAIDLDHPGNTRQLTLDDPVVDAPKFCG